MRNCCIIIIKTFFFNLRLMFFTDNDPSSRIEKAFLDGQNRVIIVYKGLARVLSLTVDTANDRLYWADSAKHTLEGSDFDGSNRRIVRRLTQASGLSYHQVIVMI